MAEQALLEGKFSVRVMPVPPAIREGCGFCLRLLPDDLEAASAFLSRREIILTEAFIAEQNNYTKISLVNGKVNDKKP